MGRLTPAILGVTDAHQHVWIAPVTGGPAGAPLLCDRDVIAAGLTAYRAAGGGGLLDCQPGGCGRDGRELAELSRLTGVPIVACTGFHLARYYPPDFWLWRATAEVARDTFVAEIVDGLVETRDTDQPVRAGFIKIAIPADPARAPRRTLGGRRGGQPRHGRGPAGAYRSRRRRRADRHATAGATAPPQTGWSSVISTSGPISACIVSWRRLACCWNTIRSSARNTTRSATSGRCCGAWPPPVWRGRSPSAPIWPARHSGRRSARPRCPARLSPGCGRLALIQQPSGV